MNKRRAYKNITFVIFILDQKVGLKEFLDTIMAIALFFDSLNEKEIQVLKHWIENSVEDRLAKEAVKILVSSKEEVKNMVASNAFILTEMEKRAEERGVQQGEKEGEKKKSIEIAKKMMQNNMPIDIIKEWTGLSDKDIELLQNKEK